MRILPLTVFALVLCAPAKADKFWLSDPAAQQNAAEGSSPDVLEGVLLAEDEAGYHIRTVGGEVVLPKSSVFKIEKDDLTVDAIVKAEAEAQAAGERANEERRLAQEQAQRERDVRAAEAAANRGARAADASAPVRPAAEPGFDPVLGIATDGPSSHFERMRDAQLMWSLTKDRRYMTLLRQLRRER